MKHLIQCTEEQVELQFHIYISGDHLSSSTTLLNDELFCLIQTYWVVHELSVCKRKYHLILFCSLKKDLVEHLY